MIILYGLSARLINRSNVNHAKHLLMTKQLMEISIM